MKKRHSVYGVSGEALSLSELRRFARGWQMDAQYRGFTDRTLGLREHFLEKLFWFLETRELETFDTHACRAFLAHVQRGHEEPDGRWGHSKVPLKPRSAEIWFDLLQALCNWLIEEEAIEASPMAKLKPPIVRPEDIQPFSPEQIDGLLRVAARTVHSRRDEALVTFLLDTGVRAAELCALRVADVDWNEWTVKVQGKGKKDRLVPFGGATRRALWRYVNEDAKGRPHVEDGPLFMSDRGHTAGEALTPNGLGRIIRRLGRASRIQNVRCSPHTFRHTFAIQFLRAGGSEFTLMKILGHTSLTMTQRYVAIARADIQVQHRLYSPADRHRRRATH